MPLLSSLPILGAPSETTKEFDAFFYKDTERGIKPVQHLCRAFFASPSVFIFVFASSSLFVARQKLLPLLRDFVSAKFPNGREKRRFTNRGRRILPTRADSRLKRIGQKSNSAKKALVTFSPASYGSLREVSPVKRDAPNPLRNIDPDDPPRFGEAFAPTTGGFA